MINSGKISNKIKYQELEELIKKYLDVFPWIGTTDIHDTIKKQYTKEDFKKVLTLHKDDVFFNWGEIIDGPFRAELTIEDIWDLREYINWNNFTKFLYDHDFYGFNISKHDFIEKFQNYLDWYFLRKQQIYKDEYYGFESIK